ncbi:MAG: hypothetical protein KTR31_38435 [Myxococcales bacterium]|nr:hypothetical protein [Myxococcales bacterium]
MTDPPTEPDAAPSPLREVVADWVARTQRLRPAPRKRQVQRLERALQAATELARAQLGPRSDVTARYAHRLEQARQVRRGRLELEPLAEAVCDALQHLSSAVAHLQPSPRAGDAVFAERFGALAVSPGDLWLDLGCGDGAALRAFAKRHPGIRTVGVELSGAVPEQQGVITVPPDPDPAVLSAATVQQVGAATVAVATLLYPLHNRLASGEHTDLAHIWQLGTLLEVLQPGGHGWLVTEDPVAWRRAWEWLLADERACEVAAIRQAVGAKALRRHGIEPYHPTARDLQGTTEAPGFTWGLVIAFRRCA